MTDLTSDERAALRALIENEMDEGTSRFGAIDHNLVRLDSLWEKLQDAGWLDGDPA